MNFERPAFIEGERKHFPGKHALEFGFEGQVVDARRHAYVEYLERAVNDHENYIDHGGAGIVYALGGEKICIKLMPEHNRVNMVDPYGQEIYYNFGNSVKGEAWFTEELSDFEVEGVRSPALVEYLEGPEYTAIVMERLNAVNLQHVFNGTADFPANFDFQDFFDRLEAYIYELHDTKHILHGDLEPRNIMIDQKTGFPRVIDFGRSRSMSGVKKEEWAQLQKKEELKVDSIKKQCAQYIK